MKRLIRSGSLLALALVFGCSGGSETKTAQNESGSTSPSKSAPLKPLVVDGVGSEPAQAVAVFLDSLRRGDENAANGVLTTRARAELQKTAYQIQPLGTPDGKYEIGRVGFPYEEKTVALVECQWTEPATEGQQPLVMEIICEVHQEAEGWRISGLGVKMVGTEDTLVLDFEDAASIQATLEGTAQSPTQTAQAQAQAQGVGSIAPVNGILTSTPVNSGVQELAPPTQLAFPPLNNAPVQR